MFKIIESIFKKIFGIFKWGAIKADSAMDKLYSMKMKVEVLTHDTLAQMETQKENSVKLKASIKKFTKDYEEECNRLITYNTAIASLQGKGKTPENDDNMAMIVMQAIDQKKVVDSMKKQLGQLKKMEERVNKLLRKFKLNKSRLESHARLLTMKIDMYERCAEIDAAGNLDINNIFGEINDSVQNMEFEYEAAQEVNSIVNSEGASEELAKAEMLTYLDNLSIPTGINVDTGYNLGTEVNLDMIQIENK